jgi:hypothetical protein
VCAMSELSISCACADVRAEGMEMTKDL